MTNVRLDFQPKEGGPAWTAALNDGATGYDVVLFLDVVPPTATSGWALELAIQPDGSVAGQITARPGFDALAGFACTVDTLRVWNARDGETVAVISEHGEPDGTEGEG
jgi:hypothetical protein